MRLIVSNWERTGEVALRDRFFSCSLPHQGTTKPAVGSEREEGVGGFLG